MVNKKEEINNLAAKASTPIDFSKIRVGTKSLTDATLDCGDYRKIAPQLGNKQEILRAINNGDVAKMRKISNFFYKTSGIYSRLCRYIAYLYKYDWLVTPYIQTESSDQTKTLSEFHKALSFLDNCQLKKMFSEISLKVVRFGCYYGYKVETNNKITLQELPPDYCRSRFRVGDRAAVEFNMRYFDDHFADSAQRMKILNFFPPEFKKGYQLYKQGKLKPDFQGDEVGWYLLDPENCVKFNLNQEDYPILIAVCPAIVDLDDAQTLDKQRMQQRLLRLIIQQVPLDKNGDLVFDTDEIQVLHNNAVSMLGRSIGVDILTTPADIDVEDLSDTTTATTTDELEKVERSVYNEAGISEMQFNTDGNLALEKSILNDEALMSSLLLQFESFMNDDLLKRFNKRPKKVLYKAQLLPTTIYNYQDLAKLYKEQTQLGYSKMLPQIALGQSQSAVLANAFFENDVLDLVNVFIPPMMSSTMSADVLQDREGAGREEKPDDEKSEKTIQNRESMS
ncbi:MAG: hypothetical protein LUC37_02130 [Prevotella sp.]|nr:hypothetical protein [Prevotella sp.]